MNTNRKYLLVIALATLAIGLLSSCKEEEEEDLLDEEEEVVLSIELRNDSEFGNILVNQSDVALYFFASDVNGNSNCSGGCADAWPPMLGTLDELSIGANLNEDYFGTITREDGETQITYKGWPLYYFSPASDGTLEAPATVTGDGRGNAFFVAKPDYTVFFGKQSVVDGEDPVTYLVDSWGLTLYDFANDEQNESNCEGGCANAWPIFNGQENPVFPSALSQSNFSMTQRNDDLGPQLSFDGMPLYYFASDEETRGNVTGHSGDGTGFNVVQPVL
jgi:predicted lipoprotein with Yx(FWY)xxD motif